MKVIPLIALALLTTLSQAVQVRRFFTPSSTDPAISQPNNNHYSIFDPALPPRGGLVVFLPGTGAVPFNQTAFIQNAASLGFHALGLMYPNADAVNEICTQQSPLDPDCAVKVRLEVIDGTDRSPLVSVDRPNCIENRLLKAVQFLHATYPLHGWNAYFTGNDIAWRKIIICGHSQGGGHAGLIAKTREVERCVMLAATDWWSAMLRPYNWLSLPPATPVERWFLIGHERDPMVSLPLLRLTSAALGTARYGDPLDVDGALPDYRGSHFLTTDLEPVRGAAGSYHGTMVSDADTPRQADGVTPVLKPAWDHLFLYQTPPIALEWTPTHLRVTFSPGILQQSTTLSGWQAISGAESPLEISRSSLPGEGFYRLGTTPK